MLFNSALFIFGFLPLALLVTKATLKVGGNSLGILGLAIASLVFYGWWDVSGIWIISVSIAANFSIAQLLSRPGFRWKLALLSVGICANVLALVYYKYLVFFVSLAGITLPTIVLPLAISFFTFQQIAFLVDVYGSGERLPLKNYLVSVLFFPHLIAGPLIHYKDIMFQFENRLNVSTATILIGLPFFAVGLAKKTFLADTLSPIVGRLFTLAETQPLDFFAAWSSCLAYTAQLYFDFSGYSDMAIGLGLMFGIALPINFLSPYKSFSIIEFWRRWHITLSHFLRDYLYIPLGGNRLSPTRRYLNLFLVMLIGGMWHGAGWTFLLWGGLHGSYLIVNHLYRAVCANHPAKARFWILPFYGLLTFLCVAIAWVFFRAQSFTGAWRVLEGMAGLTGFSLPGELALQSVLPGVSFDGLGLTYLEVVTLAVFLPVAYAIIWFAPNAVELFGYNGRSMPSFYQSTKHRIYAYVGAGAAIWLGLFGVFGSAPSEFLYFRF